MLLCRKIRLQVSEKDAATLEMIQGKCRGLYNWWVMRLKNGERWNWQDAEKTLAESRKVDPQIDQVYGKLLAELTESVPAGYQEVAISRDARGHYHASFIYEVAQEATRTGGVVAFDLGIKTLATGYNGRGRFYHIGGFTGARWYNKQLDKIRSKRDCCKKKSRRYIHLSQVYKRTYRCQNCRLVMDRDDNGAVNHYQRFLARLGPHTGDPVRCAAVFTAINTFDHV